MQAKRLWEKVSIATADAVLLKHDGAQRRCDYMLAATEQATKYAGIEGFSRYHLRWYAWAVHFLRHNLSTLNEADQAFFTKLGV